MLSHYLMQQPIRSHSVANWPRLTSGCIIRRNPSDSIAASSLFKNKDLDFKFSNHMAEVKEDHIKRWVIIFKMFNFHFLKLENGNLVLNENTVGWKLETVGISLDVKWLLIFLFSCTQTVFLFSTVITAILYAYTVQPRIFLVVFSWLFFGKPWFS